MERGPEPGIYDRICGQRIGAGVRGAEHRIFNGETGEMRARHGDPETARPMFKDREDRFDRTSGAGRVVRIGALHRVITGGEVAHRAG